MHATAPPEPATASALVRIEPLGLVFASEPGVTLLRAAEAAGIELPSSCRNGTCRTCLCRMRTGRARHVIDWPGVSAEERAEGWILPCVAEPLGGVTLEVPGARSIF
ncbi:MAG: (2Fe-2S)-binding protein [Variovorax sp.]|nr:(2Fe-2S)-binding protein [Variovorax sp.]